MLANGQKAPEFELPDQDGRKQTLKSLLKDGPLILYFYPADFTPGCTKEACSFRDLHQELLKAKLRVVGVSPQDVDSHRRFAEKHGLNFPLLADPDKQGVRPRRSARFRRPARDLPDRQGRHDPRLRARGPAHRRARGVREEGASGGRQVLIFLQLYQ